MTFIPPFRPRQSQFNEQLVVEDTQQINLKSTYGFSNLRDRKEEVGSATVTNDNTEYRLQTTANGADSCFLESAEHGRYIAGQDSVAGIGVRISATPTGNQVVRWGYFEENNGFGFGIDATGLFVFVRSGGTDTITRQADWNGDKADGTGESGFNLDLSDGHIFHINFSWYGYGGIEFSIFGFDSEDVQEEIFVHRTRVEGATSVLNPNLPIRVDVDNDGTAAAFDSIYVGGRQFATRGNYQPYRRVTAERKTLASVAAGSMTAAMSFRRKTTGNFHSVSVKPQGFDITTTQPVYVELRSGATLGGSPSYGTPTNYTASETALEVDVAGTTVSNGVVIWSGLISASGSGKNAVGGGTNPLTDVDFVGDNAVTLCFESVSTLADLTTVFRVVEEW